jgi:hypothetical protein
MGQEMIFVFHLFSLYTRTTYANIVRGRRFSYWYTEIRVETMEKEISSAERTRRFVIDSVSLSPVMQPRDQRLADVILIL